MSDVKDFKDMEIHFDIAKPFLPFEQLMAVLPAASRELLPQAFQVNVFIYIGKVPWGKIGLASFSGFLKTQPGPKVMKKVFMLNSAEHETSNALKYKKEKKLRNSALFRLKYA